MTYFFDPYVGNNYKKGFDIENGEIKLCEKENEGLKVMVLGLEHYCCDVKPCGIHTIKNGKEILNCVQAPNCRAFTQTVVNDFIHGKNYKSFIRFTNVFKKEYRGIWNYFVFSNFFQRSMPKKSSAENNAFRLGTETDVIEKTVAVNALSRIIKENLPNIIIVWGAENGPIWRGIEQNQQNLNNLGISIRLMQNSTKKYKMPRIHIVDCKGIPFTVLDIKCDRDNLHSCLIVLIEHPQHWRWVKNFDKFAPEYIKCILGNFDRLSKWDNIVKNWNGQTIISPPVCEFKNLNWTNYPSFPHK